MVQKISIIAVDDDKDLLVMLETMFSFIGYEHVTVTNASDALELIAKRAFDIMLTDVAMPGMKGFELVERARKIRPDMAVIAMTGFVEEFSYNASMEAGASDFIKKPFTLEELRARIEHVKLQAKLRMTFLTDELTGLYNRRGFFALANHLIKQAKRQKTGLFLLYADLDDLKVINDTWGHYEGDLALIKAAALLKTTYRESDVIARIGGDEFVVVFPIGIPGDDIESITGRLHKELANLNADTNGKGRYELSISVGVACFDPENPCSIDKLLVQADSKMYERKRLIRKAMNSC